MTAPHNVQWIFKIAPLSADMLFPKQVTGELRT